MRSAAPLEDGWYGGTSVCLTPFWLRKLVKSWEMNWGPLSETINFFWQSIRRKPKSHLVNSALSSCGSHVCHLYPLGMVVNQPKEVVAVLLCKVDVYSLPHPSRPPPWVQWCTGRCLPHCLTHFTAFHHQLNFCIQIRPPNITSSNRFHFNNARMFLV